MEEGSRERSSSNSSDDSGSDDCQIDDQHSDFICSECCRRFTTKRGLNCHVTATHGRDHSSYIIMEEGSRERSSSNSSDDSGSDDCLIDDQHSDFICSECCRRFTTKRGLNCHVTATHGRDHSRASGRIKCPHCVKDYSNQGNLSRHMQNQHGQCAGAIPNVGLASPEQALHQNNFESSFSVSDIVNVCDAVKRLDNNGNSAKSIVNILSSLQQKEPTKRKSDDINNGLAKRAKIQMQLCTECKRSFKSKDSLIQHQATCKKKRIKNPNSAKKAFACDKCAKSYDNKATLKKHAQNKHEDKDDGIVEKATKLKKYDCVLCKGVVVKINEHYNLKHKVVNSEQITFQNINLVPFDIHIDRGTRGANKKLQKCNRRYDDNTCRLCENHTNNLRNHYISYHQVDTGSLNNIRRMFRDSLGKIDPKPKPNVKKVNASDENERQNDDEDESSSSSDEDNDDDDDDDRLIYRCKCGIYTETYDATVEHSQEHLLAKHTNKKMSRASVFEVSDGDKVINYDYENLLTEAWFDMFKDVVVNKEIILSSSIYKCYRNVKLRSKDPDCSTGLLEYRCDMCKVFIDPKKIENHCFNHDTCVKFTTRKFCCEECDNAFNSKQGLAHHKENHAVGFRIVTFNNKNDVQINRILEKVKCSINDLQKENVHGQQSTEKVVVNDESAIRKGFEPQTQINNIDEHAVNDENTIRGESEPRVNNVIEQAANDISKTKEVTEPQPKVNHIDEHGDSPANGVNNEENDNAGTDKLPVSNDSFIQALKYAIIIIPADISMSGSENVATVVENTGSLEKNVCEQLNVIDNQDKINDDDIRQEKAESKFQSCCEHESVTRKVLELQLPLEQLDSDRISYESHKYPKAAKQADSNINVSDNIAVDSENTGLLEKGLRDQFNTNETQEKINGNVRNEENAQFKLQNCFVNQNSPTREVSELESQVNHVGEDKDDPNNVNANDKENNHETFPSCTNVDFPSDNRSQASNKNMTPESAEANLTNNEDRDTDIGEQPMNEGETDCSEDKITRVPPPKSIHTPTSVLKTSDQSNQPTSIPDITGGKDLHVYNQEKINGDDKHTEKAKFKPQNCFVNPKSSTSEVSELGPPVSNVGEDKDVPTDVNSKEKETNHSHGIFPSGSNLEITSTSGLQDSNKNMTPEPNQNYESAEVHFTNNVDPDADIDTKPTDERETDLSDDEIYSVPPPESIHSPTSLLKTPDQSNQPTYIPDITSSSGENSHVYNQETTNRGDKHAEKAQFKPQNCFVSPNSPTTEVSELRLQVNHVGEDVPNAVNSKEKETNLNYETFLSCSNLEITSARNSQNSNTNMTPELNQNYESAEANFTNNEDPDAEIETQPADEGEKDNSEDKIPPDTEHSLSEAPESNQSTSIPNITSSDGEVSYFAEFRATLQSNNDNELNNSYSIENSQVSSENKAYDQNYGSRESNSICNEDNRADTEAQDTVPHETNYVRDKLARMIPQEPQATSKSDGDEESDISDSTESSQDSSENMVQDQNYEADIEAQDTILIETNYFEDGLNRRETVITSISDDDQKSHNSQATEDPQGSTENMVQDQNTTSQTKSMDTERTGVEWQETSSDSVHQANQPAPNDIRNNDENLSESVEIQSESDDDPENFFDLAGELVLCVISTLHKSGVCL